ncbi:hypothetical protein ES703_125441 [subsurface metagenome]
MLIEVFHQVACAEEGKDSLVAVKYRLLQRCFSDLALAAGGGKVRVVPHLHPVDHLPAEIVNRLAAPVALPQDNVLVPLQVNHYRRVGSHEGVDGLVRVADEVDLLSAARPYLGDGMKKRAVVLALIDDHEVHPQRLAALVDAEKQICELP